MADDTEQSGFDLGADADAGYVVLARKYRPESFADLIGQEAMVRTLSNAFTADRIAQGYMLTGVRGVGKTTTARILARALNYHRNDVDDAEQRPTVDLSAGYGRHCVDILKSRHPDVVEMDAASNTGVDNVREIIESARYRPLNARYKVFIIDEVHMLSKGAFNALLKTLEEPPGHVKFIFATTEVRKVPVTVLSRCQRFDLRRVDVPVLVPHFAGICEKEGATADEEALALIARAAEGSVRDGLSILDQAIAMGAGSVTAASVRAMLGLADRGRIFDLLAACLSGTPKAALEAFDALHADGGDPLQLLTDLAEAVHAVSRAKTLGADGAGDGLSREERERAGELAGRLSIAILSRVWQLLVAGLDEASKAPDPRAAAEMILIRIAFTADLPTPDQIVRALGNGAAASATPANAPTSPETRGGGSSTRSPTSQAVGLAVVQAPAPKDPHGEALQDAAPSERVVASLPQHVDEPQSGHVALNSFHDVVAGAGARRAGQLNQQLEDKVRLVQ
ncbi:MAG: DNA polymerase III subunit gamma/tau, partial [Pseudomonadota bacterium]